MRHKMAMTTTLRAFTKIRLRTAFLSRWRNDLFIYNSPAPGPISSCYCTAAASSSLSLSHPSVKKYLQNVSEEPEPRNASILPIVKVILEKQEEIRELIAMGKENAELRDSAEADVRKVQELLKILEDKFFTLVVEPDRMDHCSDVILEVSAGVGGQEAMLFSNELFDMYANYAYFKGWECSVVGFDETELGGIRHGALSISGSGSYKALKFEGGVHRVQRVPKTEKSGRIHTSTSTVAVLPTPSEIEVNLRPQDLKIETKRASGAGGQHVNKTESAIRITHLPSGIVVDCQTERSQLQNKNNALKTLRARLFQHEIDKQSATIKSSRKLQVGQGGRNEKIRTYNYVQDRVTDHRISLSVHNLKEILQGGGALDDVIAQLQDFDRKERLEEMFK